MISTRAVNGDPPDILLGRRNGLWRVITYGTSDVGCHDSLGPRKARVLAALAITCVETAARARSVSAWPGRTHCATPQPAPQQTARAHWPAPLPRLAQAEVAPFADLLQGPTFDGRLLDRAASG